MAEFQLIDETITLIAALEGCKLIAYEDVTGYAIGYGSHKHLDGRSVKKGDTITHEDAIKLLKQRVENEFFPHAKRILTNSKINSYQAGAVTSLIYNCGTGKITSKSSVIKAINANPEDSKIKDLFAEWRLSGGKVCEGLCKRRAREYEFYKNKKINMNVSYVYNSNLGGYAVNDESDAVVGNSKNETKYINTNYCASIKCSNESEPVENDGDYENDSKSSNAIVNNPLVYKDNEAISIVSSLKDGGYNLSEWEFQGLILDKNEFKLTCKIRKGNSVTGNLEVSITYTSNYKVILEPYRLNINNVKNKINRYIDKQNDAFGKNYDKLVISKGTYEEEYKQLKQFIKDSNFSSDFYTYIKDDNEEFQIYCCEKSKKNVDIKDFKVFESYISQKGNSIFETLVDGWNYYYEVDDHFTGHFEVKDVIGKYNIYAACYEMLTESETITEDGKGVKFDGNGAEIYDSITKKYKKIYSYILQQKDIDETIINHFSDNFNLNISKNALFLYFFEKRECVIFNLPDDTKVGLCEVHMNKRSIKF